MSSVLKFTVTRHQRLERRHRSPSGSAYDSPAPRSPNFNTAWSQSQSIIPSSQGARSRNLMKRKAPTPLSEEEEGSSGDAEATRDDPFGSDDDGGDESWDVSKDTGDAFVWNNSRFRRSRTEAPLTEGFCIIFLPHAVVGGWWCDTFKFCSVASLPEDTRSLPASYSLQGFPRADPAAADNPRG